MSVIISYLTKLNRDKDAKYSINQDDSINVDGNVDISRLNLIKIPFEFNIVTGYFKCSHNLLTDLQGSPKIIGSSFDCSFNNLKSLSNCPIEICTSFDCSFNYLNSLVGCPKKFSGWFDCGSNLLSSLEGGPENVKSYYDCSMNKLKDLKGIAKFIGSDLYLNDNPLNHLGHLLFSNIKGQVKLNGVLIEELEKVKKIQIDF